MVAIVVIVYGLWGDFESGFIILRHTSPARAVVAVIGVGLLAVQLRAQQP